MRGMLHWAEVSCAEWARLMAAVINASRSLQSALDEFRDVVDAYREQMDLSIGAYRFPLERQLLRRGWPGRLASWVAYNAPERWLPWLLYHEELDVPLAALSRR